MSSISRPSTRGFNVVCVFLHINFIFIFISQLEFDGEKKSSLLQSRDEDIENVFFSRKKSVLFLDTMKHRSFRHTDSQIVYAFNFCKQSHFQLLEVSTHKFLAEIVQF